MIAVSSEMAHRSIDDACALSFAMRMPRRTRMIEKDGSNATRIYDLAARDARSMLRHRGDRTGLSAFDYLLRRKICCEPEVIRDLNLSKHGLNIISCDPAIQVAFPEGQVVPRYESCPCCRGISQTLHKRQRNLFALTTN